MIIMATKKTGISPDLIIHPGETLFDILEDREITQAELATLTGVSPSYVNQVIKGKKDISTKFAVALEYALGVSKSFWINLQAHYDAEKLEYEKEHTVTEGEIDAYHQIKDIIKYLRQSGRIPSGGKIENAVISVREALQVSNITAFKDLCVEGAFRMPSNKSMNPYVLGAWLRLCQLRGTKHNVTTTFKKENMAELSRGIKKIMCSREKDFHADLKKLLAKHGIDFSIIRNFRGAPVQGYITRKTDGSYQMVLTIRGAYADIFWFSLFHELGHIYYEHIKESKRYIDYETQSYFEEQADNFATNQLIPKPIFNNFVEKKVFTLDAIHKFALEQGVMPYIVIGRLQKCKIISYSVYSKEKLRYKWNPM